MTSPDSNADATSNKYNVQIGESKGIVIGNNPHVVQHFYGQRDTRVPTKVPFMAPDLLPGHIERPRELTKIKSSLLPGTGDRPTTIPVVLYGAGGYGKTTLAMALCYDERIQQAFNDGILWVTLGENPGNLVGKVEDWIYTLSRERPNFNGIDAATARLAELLAERDMLLVIDDVWNAVHLKPFIQG